MSARGARAGRPAKGRPGCRRKSLPVAPPYRRGTTVCGARYGGTWPSGARRGRGWIAKASARLRAGVVLALSARPVDPKQPGRPRRSPQRPWRGRRLVPSAPSASIRRRASISSLRTARALARWLSPRFWPAAPQASFDIADGGRSGCGSCRGRSRRRRSSSGRRPRARGGPAGRAAGCAGALPTKAAQGRRLFDRRLDGRRPGFRCDRPGPEGGLGAGPYRRDLRLDTLASAIGACLRPRSSGFMASSVFRRASLDDEAQTRFEGT